MHHKNKIRSQKKRSQPQEEFEANVSELRTRLVNELEAGVTDAPSFSTDDPLGLVKDLEASGKFHKDSGLGRIYHPGKTSFREKKPTDALHIVIDDNRVSAHVDKHSPLKFSKAGTRYSMFGIAAHNLTGMFEELGRILRGRKTKQRCELELERVTPDGQVIDHFLQRPRSADVIAEMGTVEGQVTHISDHETHRLPFSVIDEAVHLLDAEAAPCSIQLEVRVAGRLDEDRLRKAIFHAAGRHPMARGRKVAARRTRHSDDWEVRPGIDLDPLMVVKCRTADEVQTARCSLQSLAVPLAESPPLRARLVRNPGGDYLMLNVNHAASDGLGALRIMRSIGKAYSNEPDPMPQIDFLAARDFPERLAAPKFSTKLRRYAALGEKLRDLIFPTARLASQDSADEPGYGFHHERLSVEQTRGLTDVKRPGTVNDVLVSALHLAIEDWNKRHRARCRRVGVLVPANMRSPKWRNEIVGNFSLPARISTRRKHRATPAKTLEAVTIQTTRKNKSGMGTALIEVLKASRFLPLWAKQASVALLPLTGNRLVDTALISNLGNLDDPPSFEGAGETTEMWFSAPARMPLGLSMGAATVNGSLHLSFRYRHRMFSTEAARLFAECYLHNLGKITEHRVGMTRDPHSIPVRRLEELALHG